MNRELCRVFADLLEYPGPGLAVRAGEGVARLSGRLPESAARLERFRAQAASDHGRLEEAYTSAFDLRPNSAPYLGHHLCGESHRRSLFLVRLRGLYREHEFAAREDELPDHLAVVLRFLASGATGGEVSVLVRDGLGPALEKMLENFGSGPHPYRELLTVLQEVVQAETEATAACERKEVAQ